MNKIIIDPIKKMYGEIYLPGSKSISNRLLILTSMLNKKIKLSNLLECDDVNYMIESLLKLGVYIEKINNKSCNIIGDLINFNNEKLIELYIGNSGTSIRFLTSILSSLKCNIIIDGNKRMRERPIGDLVNALRLGGAKIFYLNKENYPPIHIKGGYLNNKINIKGNMSSQFVSSILMSSIINKNNTIININDNLVSKPYIDMTIKLMNMFNIKVKNYNYKKIIVYKNNLNFKKNEIIIEGDASNASYFLAAGSIIGGPIKIYNINKNSIQGDIKFTDIIIKMGGKINFGNNYIESYNDGNKNINNIDMDMNDIPDVAMTAAIMSIFAKKESIIRNIYNWRLKETDRILAMENELTKIGAKVESGIDYIKIYPPKKILKADINTYDDHRMAMCFSLVALSDSGVNILNPECVNKTFPEYFNLFKSLIKK
ncbi:3-phosphoshikimate 1-carboxyvinyltransferase [Candidatus Nardonella dryophthoridicola]|uniref:3-phosphoshikimate 1-carboxyvinyltransferase n=1 Tax=endosymbiont of Rhynchophorus ferrugineus TaxID=1972133 RepID=A0A2Z5T3K0_9GAMM|nr:3-phosphoshikimate 1-carboxyvinyltransferase [Candidatus Nardonella dryophthoridicola]BBA84970.1 3-phosphoshikimate 1-carboxyvinyltransferase [endosymbiont of Rhynchophorus ferrugineus]